jgi:hypothetical protein
MKNLEINKLCENNHDCNNCFNYNMGYAGDDCPVIFEKHNKQDKIFEIIYISIVVMGFIFCIFGILKSC